MNYILNVINILVYINSASTDHTSSASVMLCCVIVHSVINYDKLKMFSSVYFIISILPRLGLEPAITAAES